MASTLNSVLRIRVTKALLRRIGRAARSLDESQASFIRYAILTHVEETELDSKNVREESVAATGGQS